MTSRRRRRRSRSKYPNALPKGAYYLPNGSYVTQSVGPPNQRGQRPRVRGVHRSVPDPKAVAQALLAIAIERVQAPPADTDGN
jgi:hypothetical protein